MRYSYSFPILLLFATLASCSKKDVEELQPTKGTITESVYASGIIKAEDQYTVFATVSGVLQQSFYFGRSICCSRPIFVSNRK